MELAPSNTSLAGGIDLASLRKAPLYQKYGGAVAGTIGNAYGPLAEQAQKISSVLFALESNSLVAFARGDISQQDLEPTLQSHGWSRSGDGLFTAPAGAAVLFPRRGVVEVGPKAYLAHTVQRGLPEPILQKLRDLPNADQIWFVSTQGVPPSVIPRTTNAGAAVASLAGFVNGAAVGLGIDSGIHLQANLTCASPQGAKQVHDALRGIIALGRLTVRDDQTDLLHIYDAIRVDQDGALVHVHADLSPELSDKLAQLVQSQLQSRQKRAA